MPQYLKGAAGAILVGDLTRRESMDSLPRHEAMYRKENPAGAVLLAFNKADLLSRAEIRKIEQDGIGGTETASKTAFWTSAKMETNVQALFEAMAVQCLGALPQ